MSESAFLFCFSINQRRHFLVCRRDACGYLDESGEYPRCTHEPTIQYLQSFDKGLKKKHKGGQHPEEESDEGKNQENEVVPVAEGNGESVVEVGKVSEAS